MWKGRIVCGCWMLLTKLNNFHLFLCNLPQKGALGIPWLVNVIYVSLKAFRVVHAGSANLSSPRENEKVFTLKSETITRWPTSTAHRCSLMVSTETRIFAFHILEKTFLRSPDGREIEIGRAAMARLSSASGFFCLYIARSEVIQSSSNSIYNVHTPRRSEGKFAECRSRRAHMHRKFHPSPWYFHLL